MKISVTRRRLREGKKETGERGMGSSQNIKEENASVTRERLGGRDGQGRAR